MTMEERRKSLSEIIQETVGIKWLERNADKFREEGREEAQKLALESQVDALCEILSERGVDPDAWREKLRALGDPRELTFLTAEIAKAEDPERVLRKRLEGK